ncbi:MAG: alanine racemase [Novosphingobium sp.]
MIPPEPPPGSLRLTIDGEALAANWRALDAMSGSAAAGAAVKADAYGLGMARVAPVLREAGCATFFVAHWCEVASLLVHVPPAAIVVLHGPATAAEAAYGVATGVRPAINTLAQAQLWRAARGGVCDLMVDTGINRLGLPLAELGDPAIAALRIDTLHSHLASADEDSPLNAVQLARWNAARGEVRHRRASLANSAGIALGPAYHGDLTRPGLALYGGVPRPELAGVIRQVARPETALLQVREVTAGEGVGYNSTFVAPAPMRLGVVALGYADGYLRAWSHIGMLRAGDAALPVVGRVSMDMTIVDLAAAPHLQEGDWLAVDYGLPTASAMTGLSQYELLTLLGKRFCR